MINHIGTRHLSRLFQKHLKASPIQVAKTTRVQLAKRMLDETDLSMSEIAMRAGFGSLRRFNAVFAMVYRRPPTEIRKTRASFRQMTVRSRWAKVFNQPNRSSRVEVHHVLATQRYDEIAEAMPVRLDQPTPVFILFDCHAVKHSRRLRVFSAELSGIGRIDPAIFLFRGNGKSKYLLL